MKKVLVRTVLSLCLLGALAISTGCASTTAREQSLSGDQMHERSAIGMDSQVGDN